VIERKIMTLKMALYSSIKHWRRMIKWAKTQNPDTEPNHRDLWLGLQTVWNHGGCDVCKYFFMHLEEKCVLNPDCCTKIRICHEAWNKLNFSKTWKEWIGYSQEFLAVLVKCHKEVCHDADQVE